MIKSIINLLLHFGGRYDGCPHFTDEEIEVCGEEMVSPRSHSWQVVEAGLELRVRSLAIKLYYPRKQTPRQDHLPCATLCLSLHRP